ncbi:uncharacterized protein LOC135384947 [Ornithodoros turicata]|uniref:uncharacterized protein LOC135384947 n=1 Tax=Ornithodoros turicata TaxID=34597 RepID=UPI003139D8B7
MSFFVNPSRLDIVFPHPSDSSRPLFYIVDSVHLLKCIRNNWVNQKNHGRVMYHPFFHHVLEGAPTPMLSASFNTLCKLHSSEQGELIKLSHGLTMKALNPSNLERQNVKLALQVFSSFVVEALRQRSDRLENADETAEFVDIIVRWWSVVNVKTPRKGHRLRDPLQQPVTSMTEPQIVFLNSVVEWLDEWQRQNLDSGRLTRETHQAFRLTCYALTEVSRYCLEELGFTYVLLGKFQTDSLEERFGQYRRLSGTQYHISVRQIYESENKLRLQKMMSLPLEEEMGEMSNSPADDDQDFDIEITDEDIASKRDVMAAITYVAGYCAHPTLKKLTCKPCEENLVLTHRELVIESSMIENLTRGGLKFPQPFVVNSVLYTELVVEKLMSEKHAVRFHAARNQRQLVVNLTQSLLDSFEDFDCCVNGHAPGLVLRHILCAATNTVLKNYCSKRNDRPLQQKPAGKNRKAATLKHT